MKKPFIFLLSSLLVFGPTLASCGEVNNDTQEENKNPDENQDNNNQEGSGNEGEGNQEGSGNEGEGNQEGSGNEGEGNQDNTDIDDSKLELKTISAARELVTGTDVKIKGVISKFFYLDNMEKKGYLLADETGSVLVNDENIASTLKEGNKVTIVGTKTDDEHQLIIKNSRIIENDNGTSDFNSSIAKELSVQDCLSNSSNDITLTGNLYKTVAKITSKSGTGDGGPYTTYKLENPAGKDYISVYSKNSGIEFAWLDEYVGTSQLVYYTIINYKKSNSTYYPRVLPVHVGFLDSDVIADKDAPLYIMDKYIAPQFEATYDNDPNKELLTKVTDTDKDLEEATISYTSINENIATITELNGKTIFNLIDQGEGSIKATITYKNSFTAERTFDFSSMIIIGLVKTNNVKEALDAPYFDDVSYPKETSISVTGQVYASGDALKNTFYVGDSTGVILILAEGFKDITTTLNIGDKVYIEGQKVKYGNSTKYFGTTLIDASNIEIVSKSTAENNQVEIDKTSYVTDKTLSDLVTLADKVTEDQTKVVYTIKGKLQSTKLVSGDTGIFVYTSDVSKLEWAKSNEEITMDIALVNLNKKTQYRCAILAVYNADGTVKRNVANFQ